jgi:glycosyltransferase involved in cell wall biosynthesis
MKILHLGKFYPPHRGGIETHLEILCRELRKSAEIAVIVANHRPGDETESIEGVAVRRLHSFLSIAAAPICQRMIQEIRATPADIVHLHTPNPYAALAFLMSGHPAALVVSWHSDIVRQRILAQMLGPFERFLMRRAVALIASSPNYIDTSPVLKRNRAKCRVIPYGIDGAEFRPRDAVAIAAIRRRYGARLVLAVGRLVYYKGFEHLIRAMTDVCGHLLIVGEGPLRMRLQAEATRSGAAARVTFLGNVTRAALLDYYQAADVFALPSVARSEAFGIVQLEAMASGVPVVNTRLPSGVPFVSVDGETGLTVEPAAPAAFGAAINRLLDTPELRARYGAAAKRRVSEHFSLAAMVDRTLGLYEEILAQSAEPPYLPAVVAQLGH